MTTTKIRLTSSADVIDFVSAADKCPYDVDVSYNRIVIDAKSLVGVMSMGLTNVLTVRYHEEDAAFAQAMHRFSV